MKTKPNFSRKIERLKLLIVVVKQKFHQLKYISLISNQFKKQLTLGMQFVKKRLGLNYFQEVII